MRNPKQAQQHAGLTLIEVMLVLAIAASFIILGLRQYQIWKADSDIRQLRYHVDSLFDAMSGFYKSNCRSSDGKLNPHNNPQKTIVLGLKDDLKNYIDDPNPHSPLVDVSNNNGYVAQFNQYSQERSICLEMDSGKCKNDAPVGEVITWFSQVAIKLPDSIAANGASANAYLAMLGGDCLSKMSGDKVEPCDGSTVSNSGANDKPYVVWQRPPGFNSEKNKSQLWMMNRQADQFTQMYTTYPSSYLIGSKGSTPGDKTQYFYCGE